MVRQEVPADINILSKTVTVETEIIYRNTGPESVLILTF